MPKVEITLFNIMEYIGNRSRPLQEGEAVFRAGHIILCGLEASNIENIASLCLQTSALSSQPHEITITLHSDVKKWKCVCSCKAGMSGFCKHIIATLIYINRNEELETVSCTDLKQKWGKEKKSIKEMYEAKPFKTFCHPKIKDKFTFSSFPELEQENFAFISTGVADSAITKFLNRSEVGEKTPELKNDTIATLSEVHPELSKLGSSNSKDEVVSCKNRDFMHIQFLLNQNCEFLNQLKEEVSVEKYDLKPCCQQILTLLSETNILEVATKYEQGSSIWAKERQLRITGSTCYSIFTFKKNEEWENKAKKFFFPKHFTNKFVEHGRQYEEEALNALKKEYVNGHIVTPGLIICKVFPWIGHSPDGVIFENGVPTKLVEIKCPYKGKENDAQALINTCDYIEQIGEEIRLKEKHSYYGQVQLGMAVLGLNSTDFIVYSSFKKNYVKIQINFDKKFAQLLFKKITDNYFKHMLHFYCLNKD